MLIPSRLRVRMAEKGVEPEELAQKLGVTPSVVCMWMSGKRRPRIRRWGRIEQVLGTGLFEEETQ